MPLTNPTLVTRQYASTTGTLTSADQIALEDAALPSSLQGSGNVQAALGHLTGAQLDAARLTALEAKVDQLAALVPDVSTLDEWAAVYVPQRAAQVVDVADGYSLIADYRSSGNRYESSNVVYSDAGVNVVTYTGLSTSVHRSFGFRVSAPADKVLMWIVDGEERIPFVDVTAAGNYRMNNFTPATATSEVVRDRAVFNQRTSGADVLTAAGSEVSTYTLSNFPSGASETSRRLDFNIDILVNGNDTLAGDFVNIPLPAANTGEPQRTVFRNVYLGPLYGNRTTPVTIGYTLRVEGANLVIDFTLESAELDVTVRVNQVATYLSYTAPSTTPRVDDFQTLTRDGSNYVFTGANEVLITFQPHTFDNSMNAVAVAITDAGVVEGLDDVSVPTPTSGFASVEIPDDIEFRTFLFEGFLRHADLRSRIPDYATQWAYGLARLRAISEHAISEPIDLTNGSTIGGAPINPAGILPLAVVYQATAIGTAAGELASSAALPTDYASYDFVHITEIVTGEPNEWRHTVISTALLASGHVQSNDNIRIQGNSDMAWVSTTREVAIVGGAQTIYRVSLIDV